MKEIVCALERDLDLERRTSVKLRQEFKASEGVIKAELAVQMEANAVLQVQVAKYKKEHAFLETQVEELTQQVQSHKDHGSQQAPQAYNRYIRMQWNLSSSCPVLGTVACLADLS